MYFRFRLLSATIEESTCGERASQVYEVRPEGCQETQNVMSIGGLNLIRTAGLLEMWPASYITLSVRLGPEYGIWFILSVKQSGFSFDLAHLLSKFGIGEESLRVSRALNTAKVSLEVTSLSFAGHAKRGGSAIHHIARQR